MKWIAIPEEDPLTRVIRALNERFRRGVGVADVQTLSASGTVALSLGTTIVRAMTGGGSVTVTLPKASSVVGFLVKVKKPEAANTVTVAAAAGDTIDGNPSVSWTTQYVSSSLVAHSAGWDLV